jgi:hypothetical protein
MNDTKEKVVTIKEGQVVDDGKYFSTSELNVAGYLHFKGKRVVSADRLESGKYEITFSNPELENGKSCEELEIEFLNSEYIKFDNSMKTIKKIIYSKNNSGRRK